MKEEVIPIAEATWNCHLCQSTMTTQRLRFEWRSAIHDFHTQ
jgi:hypothetical protein